MLKYFFERNTFIFSLNPQNQRNRIRISSKMVPTIRRVSVPNIRQNLKKYKCFIGKQLPIDQPEHLITSCPAFLAWGKNLLYCQLRSIEVLQDSSGEENIQWWSLNVPKGIISNHNRASNGETVCFHAKLFILIHINVLTFWWESPISFIWKYIKCFDTNSLNHLIWRQ